MKFLVFGVLFLTAIYLAESRHTLTKRDVENYDDSTKDDLKTQIENLKKQAEEAIKKLIAEGKGALAEGIKKVETQLADLESQLEKLSPKTEVGKALLKAIEALVKGVETKLEEELKKINSVSYYDDETKKAILKAVEDLLDNSRKAIDALKKSGKKELVNGLTKSLAFVKDIDTKLKALKPTTDLGKTLLEGIDNLVKEGEMALASELKKAQGGAGYYDDVVKNAILKQVEDLLDKARKAIDTLAKTGKKELISGLTQSLAFTEGIEKNLKELKPTTDLGKALLESIQKLVVLIEQVFKAELKKAQSFYYEDKTQEELKRQLENLKKQAEDAIKKLVAEGKGALAEGIKKLETQLADLESQLEKLNPKTEVGKALLKAVEALIKGAETKLEEELKKINSVSYYDDETKKAFLKAVEDLLDNARKAIDALTKSGKKELVNGLTKSLAFVKDIDTKLKALKPTTDLGKTLLEGIDNLVKEGEMALAAELKKAQGGAGYYDDAVKKAILKQVEDLLDKARKAIDTLAKTGKKELISGLTQSLAFTEGIEKNLKELKPTTDLGKALLESIQKLVSLMEQVFKAELKKAQS